MRLTRKEVDTRKLLTELEPGDYFKFPNGSSLYIVTDNGHYVGLATGAEAIITNGDVVIPCDCNIEYWEVQSE